MRSKRRLGILLAVGMIITAITLESGCGRAYSRQEEGLPQSGADSGQEEGLGQSEASFGQEEGLLQSKANSGQKEGLRQSETVAGQTSALQTKGQAGEFPGQAIEKLPASYDGRLWGRAPQIKNQDSLGTCWAFASLMALEARLLPGEDLEFSADHMSLGNGFHIPQEAGGEYTMSMAYLLSWQGPVLEADDPYGDGISAEGLKAVKHVQEILMLPGKDYEKIKQAVWEYGGVQSSLYTSMADGTTPSAYYNEEQYVYCYIGSASPNHDVVIIGWEDEYPKGNFSQEVNGDGAFLCTNSWGDDFGNQGYFYVSYYDSNIGLNNIVYTVVENPDNYSHIYQSDLRGWVGQLGYGNDTVWFANVYQAHSRESLAATGFYSTDRHSSYEIYVARDIGEEEEILNGHNLEIRKKAAAGSLDYAGFYTIPLDLLSEKERTVKEGERFAVLVKLTTPGSVHPAAVEFDAGDGRTAVNIQDGEGYISADGQRWSRVETEQSANICLKAYTRASGQ